MIQCIGCKSFSFKRVAPSDALKGKGHCANRAPFIRHSAMEERDCEQYKKDEAEVVQARVNWLKSNEENRK